MSNAPRITETYAASTIGAFVGLVQWAVATYAFGGHEPAPVEGAILIILPAVFGGLLGFFTRRTSKEPEPPT